MYTSSFLIAAAGHRIIIMHSIAIIVNAKLIMHVCLWMQKMLIIVLCKLIFSNEKLTLPNFNRKFQIPLCTHDLIMDYS